MSSAAGQVEQPLLAALLAGAEGARGGEPGWLTARREAALAAARTQGLPGPRDEEWRALKVRPLVEASASLGVAASAVDASAVASYGIPEASSSRIVFWDGVYRPELSCVDGVGAGVRVRPLAEALGDPEVERHLGRVAGTPDAFVAASTAQVLEGAVVQVGRDVAAAAPIHVLFASSGTAGAARLARCLVVAGMGAKATIIEEHVGPSSGEGLTVGVCEVVAGPSASLDVIALQRQGAGALHVAATAAEVASGAQVRLTSIALGAKLSRHHIHVAHTGPEAHSELWGLAVLGEEQVADAHTATDHRFPRGTSRQVHKVIADGRSQGIFNGKIFVQKDAQQIAAEQLNQGLLLSRKARIHAKPQLEIWADDVRCTHGATVGQLDEEQLFYLLSRGIDAASARSMLTYAFAAAVAEPIPVASVRRRLQDHIAALFAVEL